VRPPAGGAGVAPAEAGTEAASEPEPATEPLAEPENPNDDLLVTVTDMGEGVAADRRDQIFAPFYTTKPRGTGLGLAITKDRVEQLGGAILLKSPVPPEERSAAPEWNAVAGPGAASHVWLPVEGEGAGAEGAPRA
jgi:signal transduction histidine kinase